MKTTSNPKVKLFAALIVLLTNISLVNGQTFNTAFTLSDGAQSHQIAFNALGFLTGNFCSDSFVPPGKVADYFGFQYLRDNDVTGMGHNSDFSGIVGNNLLSILDSTQKAMIISTAKAQEAIIQKYAMQRLPLIYAFVRMKDKSMPTGSPGLDSTAVKAYSAELYRVDARVCIQRAKLYATIINSLTAKQKGYLDSLVKIGGRNMPVLPLQINQRGLNNNQFVGAMSLADDIFSWYVGSVEADVYFCPERQGNYFGSYYLKDAPAMGNPNYSIDTSLSQTGGQRMLNTLNQEQRDLITQLTNKQKAAMLALVQKRTEISTVLRGYISGKTVDTAQVVALSATYGELDGIISYHYASNFSKVNWTLSTIQMDTLMKIRNLDNYPCTGAYSYSDKISMPTIENTDYLFLSPAAGSAVNNVVQSAGALFPNPFVNYIQVNDISSDASYQMTDVSGRIVWAGNHIENQNFSTLPKGVYFVKIVDNQVMSLHKLIKD
jgi:hypothetical protein